MMKPNQSVTQLAHQHVRAVLRTGDCAVDATCGNGHDTVFLARCVGVSGHVLACDIQQKAIENTTQRLIEQGFHKQTQLHQASHAQIASLSRQHLSASALARLRTVMYNLGYLPGGDKSLITQEETTLESIRQAWPLLATDGLLSIIVYPAHPGGLAEAEAVRTFWRELRDADRTSSEPRTKTDPQALFARKRTPST